MIADCPATPLYYGAVRGTPPALSSGPWAYASPGISGFVFGARHGATVLELPTGGAWADGQAAKVLWWPRKGGAARSITIRGRSFDGGGTFLQASRASSSGYPSIVEIPSEGCWRLDIVTGRLRGTVVVRAVSP